MVHQILVIVHAKSQSLKMVQVSILLVFLGEVARMTSNINQNPLYKPLRPLTCPYTPKSSFSPTLDHVLMA